MQRFIGSIRQWFAIGGVALLAACSLPADENAPSVPFGNFTLAHNVVVVEEPQIGPFSRKATDEDWEKSITAAVERKFGAYDGGKLYHIGIKVDAYALAMPGIPVVFKPKSVLAITVTLWDDASQTKRNAEPKQLIIFEGLSAESLIGSGLTQNKRKQMKKLSTNAAQKIQDWILENPEWVGLPPLPKKDANAEGDEKAN